MEAISKVQIKSIYALAASMNLVHRDNKDDPLHQLVIGLTGESSIASLTAEQALEVLLELNLRKKAAYAASSSAGKRPITEKPGGVSAGQQKKIIALMCELRKLDVPPNRASIEKRVAGIIRKYLHISATEKEPYAWLTYRHGLKLIEVIKGQLNTAQEQTLKRG